MKMELFKRVLKLGALTIMLSGCSRSPKTNFYLLNSAPSSELKQYKTCHRTIFLRNVNIAKYLDKPNIVTRIMPNKLKVSEFNQWGGSDR